MRDLKPRTALLLALTYALIAGLWIFLANRLLMAFTTDPRLLSHLDTIKGVALVVVTALLLYVLLRRELQRLKLRDAQIRETQAALRESEQRLSMETTALQSAANAVMITDREGRITWTNSAFTRLTGYTAAETLGQTPRLLKSDRHDQAFYRNLWETILAGEVWRGEITNRRRDGSLFTEEQTITPMRDERGEISHFIAILQDITARKEADAALRGSEEKFRNLVENTSDWVWEINERGVYTYCSPRIREILGYAPEEVLGKTPFDLMPAEEAKRVAELFAPISGAREPFALLDNVNLHKDGHRVILETSATPIVDSQGVFRGYRGIDRDITERKRAEEALRNSEERYRLLFETNPHPMWVYDLETLAFLAVNDAAVRHYGYSRDEFLAMTIKEIRPPEDIPALLQNVARVTSGLDEAGTWRHRKKDGTIINVEITSHTLIFAGRRAEVVLANDVTERNRAEVTLRARAHQQAVVAKLGQRALGGTELSTLLEEAVTQLAHTLDVEYCKVLERLPDGDALLLRAGVGWKDGCVGHATVGAGTDSQAGYTLLANEPVIVEDMRTETRFTGPPLLHDHGVVSGLSVIIPARDGPFGVLGAHTTRRRTFTRDDVHFLQAVANVLASANDRKRVEEALREVNETLTALIHASPLAIMAVDPAGTVKTWNPAAERIFGWSEEQVHGRRLPIVPEDKQDEFLALRQRVLQGESFTGVEVRRQRRDGSPIDVSISAAPLRDARGDISGIMGVIADITERKRMVEALIRRTRQLDALRAVSAEITRELDLATLLRLIVRRAAELVGAASGTVFLWDERDQVLVPEAWHGFGEWRKGVRLQLGEAVAGMVAQWRRGMIVNDYRTSPYAHPLTLERTGITAVLAEPLLYHEQLVGVLAINDEGTGRHFTEEDRATLALFATQAAIAIENARLHETTIQRAQQLAKLNELTRVLTTVLDPQQVAQEILAATQVLIPGAAGRLWEQVDEAGGLRLVASIGLREPQGGIRRRFLLGEGMTGIAAATHEPVISPDVATDPRFVNQAWARAEGLVACIVLPLIYGEEIHGALVIFTREPHTFSDEEVSLLRSFAAQAAVSLEKASLFAATERAAREARSLYEVAHRLTTSLDSMEVLHLIAAKTTELLRTPHAQVVLWDEESQTLRLGAAYGTEMERVKTQQFRVGEGVNGLVAQTRKPLIVNDYQAFPQRVNGLTHVGAVIGVPLLYRDRFLGVLTSHAIQSGSAFTPDHLALLTSFADQAAVAIENARLYQEIQQHAAELEERVRQRTRELEEASRHKSEFLANMSHELRTPLNSIIGFAEFLQEQRVGSLNEKQARYLGHIRASGQHLVQIIGDILDLSKAEAGRIVLQPESLSVATTLEDILVTTRGLAHQKHQSVEADIQPDLPPVWADPVRFKQILFNLLSNAVKFTPDGGHITLRAYQKAESTKQKAAGGEQQAADASVLPAAGCLLPSLVIEVTDTGIGIKAEDLPRLFQQFVQLEAAATKHHEGTGLGLALTKRLVELHGGRIWAESAGEGQGSTFTAVLPFGGPGD